MDDFVIARDGVRLAMAAYRAEEEAEKAPAVLVLHGIASHMGWYRGLAREMARAGISAYLADRRGSGLSEGVRGHALSWRVLAADVAAVGAEIERRDRPAALHLMGISLGSVIALASVLLRPEPWKSLILFSPGLATFYRAPLWRRLQLVHRSLLRPRKLHELPFSVEQLTDEPAWRIALSGDPLRTRELTARFIVETFRMQGFVRANMSRVRLPVACFLGESDRIVDNVEVVRALARLGSKRVHLETFEGASHILPASVPESEMVDRLRRWLEEGEGGGRTSIRTPRFSGESYRAPEPPTPDSSAI